MLRAIFRRFRRQRTTTFTGESVPRYFVHYQDDGADHPEEAVEPGEAWDRLVVFDTPKRMLDFIHDVQVETFRLNPRVLGFWAEGDDHYEQSTRFPDGF